MVLSEKFKKRYKFLLVLFVLQHLNTFAQYGNVWCFGINCGLDFNSGIAQPFGPPTIYSTEGVSSICDENGQLLLYTNGEKCYDRNFNVLPNGDSLLGDKSTSQGTIFIPDPGDSSRYYLFTVDADVDTLSPGLGGLHYHIIDMDLNGGLGDIVSKNQHILHPTTEKVTATRHCNGVDWWIVVQHWYSSNYYAYLLTGSGLSTNPVISNSFYDFPPDQYQSVDYLGQMKISNNGKYLINCYTDYGLIDILNFNNSNGSINNLIFRDTLPPSTVFGLTFSPKGNFIYIGAFYPYNTLYQYNISTLNQSLIRNNRINVFPFSVNNSRAWGPMQQGIDKKIYTVSVDTILTNHFTINVIDLPELAGVSCDFHNASNLLNGTLKLGLPNYPDCIFARKHTATLHLPLCGGLDSALVVFDTLLNVVHDFTWNFGDPASGVNNTATGTDPVHAFSAAGNYTITLTASNACNTFTVTRNVYIGISTSVPPVISQNGIQLQSTAGQTYQWYLNGQLLPGATFQSIIPAQAGMYTVQVTDAGGCVLQSEGYYVYVTQNIQKEKLPLKIYPNPAHTQVHIQSGSSVIKVEAINLSGQCLKLSYQNDIADISSLSPGLYMLRVCTQEGVAIKKLLVE